MAEMIRLHGGGGGGGGEEEEEEESLCWSQDFDIPPSDQSAGDISATVEVFDRENQVNFVMDLIDQHVDQSEAPDPDFDLDLRLGFCMENHDLGDDVDNHSCGFVSANWDSRAEPGESSIGRMDGVFSDSDKEVVVDGINLNGGFDEENACEDDRSSVQICWDSFQLEEHQGEGGEDFEWEQVDGRVDEREVLSMFFDADVDDDLDMSVAMEVPSEEELGIDQVRNVEWEMLLNIHNLDSNGENADDEYEMLVGQFAGTEVQKPPASRAAVKSLPLVVMTKGDVEGDNALCAICKDDMGIGEKAKMLPCSHHYHGCCIEPWLGMRNTCPVCRYELPTDDPEYERRKIEQGGRP